MACRKCNAPTLAFELVRAAAADGSLAGDLDPRALVRSDMCVGCGTCVDACPEPGALTMRGKLAVVDDARCRGHGECVAACPVGAIAVTTGAAVNRVSVPLVDAHFETTVPGLHVVGELGGRGLIKNAINEGKIAMQHIAREPRSGRPSREAGDGALDVVIVGSGPAGLSAGIEAIRAGLSYVVLEQGSLAESVRKYPRHKLLLAEPVSMPLYGDLWVADTSKEDLLRIWEQIVASSGLQVQTGERVEVVRCEGPHFRIITSQAQYLAHRVVLAMGRRGSPRKLGVPGEGLAKVLYEVIEMEEFQHRHVLVVGGGDSAVECAVGLANQVGTTVHLSYRGDRFARIKPRNQQKLDQAVVQGKVKLLLGTQVREIMPDCVLIEGPAGPINLRNDDVVIRIGGDPPYAFLERLGVRIVPKDIPIAGDQEQVS
ncbi:MAG: NAD(P)-binding domain-containing protein [Gemmatimonadales bacterium]|nr:NAD(P)-binding domain-containing protein [Gemmatimonadales bacterium]